MKFSLIPLTQLKDFDKNQFYASPNHYGYKCINYFTLESDLHKKIIDASQEINEMCICIIEDSVGTEYVLSQHIPKSVLDCFVIFNAAKSSKNEKTVHTIISTLDYHLIYDKNKIWQG